MKRTRKLFTVFLAFLCIVGCFAGCKSSKAKRPTETAVFPNTTWGMSASEVEQRYKGLTEADSRYDNQAVYQLDSLDFYGVDMKARFHFYQKDGSSWLWRVELISNKPMSDEELLAYIEKEEIKEINALTENLPSSLTAKSVLTEQEEQFNKNCAYLGIQSDHLKSIANIYTVGGSVKESDSGKYYGITFDGLGCLFCYYDFETNRSID